MEATGTTSSQILLSRGVASPRPGGSRSKRPKVKRSLSNAMAAVALALNNCLEEHQSTEDDADAIGGVLHLNSSPTTVASLAMTMPVEITHIIYLYLAPIDFHAARRTCRAWHTASMDRSLLITLLQRGGWWSSVSRILSPIRVTDRSSWKQTLVMSKWLARESALANTTCGAFQEVGYTDFRKLSPESERGLLLHGDISFTASLCGKYLLAVCGKKVYLYELNHVCGSELTVWSLPLEGRTGLPLGSLRPVTIIDCPQRVISCSMDTSAGRSAVAFLMEGRTGIVCDIMPERLRSTTGSSGYISWSCTPVTSGSSPVVTATGHSQTIPCICQRAPVTRALPVEDGSRSVYRNICHPDDPPRSVALCPQRNCVAFGCSSGIELHWADALTGRALSRWFPLTSPSDYLYFLPPRRSVDTSKRLRLISSATSLGSTLEALGSVIHGFSTTLLGSGSTSVVAFVGPSSSSTPSSAVDAEGPGRASNSEMLARDDFDSGRSQGLLSKQMIENSADHYRAVPLSDGYHILFTDPYSGNLCLGTDAPVGSLTRLLRKVWFCPPQDAASPVPILYTAGADIRHGVRIAATFAAKRGELSNTPTMTSARNEQIVMFYTIPPDMFHDIARVGLCSNSEVDEASSEWVSWRAEGVFQDIDIVGDPYHHSSVYPLEVRGQNVAECPNLVEIALDSSPEMVIWGFMSDGFAKTWALDTGDKLNITRTEIQRDGSLRYVNDDGDLVMADEGSASTPSTEPDDLVAFDGPSTPTTHAWTNALPHRQQSSWTADRMSATVSVDLVEELRGITRVDVELR